MTSREEPVRDRRTHWEGTSPLRRSFELPKLPVSQSSMAKQRKTYVYEGQISLSVFGIDRVRWNAYAFIDGWFPGGESIHAYSEDEIAGGKPDPVASGQMDLEPAIQDPRVYFLKVAEIRVQHVAEKYEITLRHLERNIQWQVKHRSYMALEIFVIRWEGGNLGIASLIGNFRIRETPDAFLFSQDFGDEEIKKKFHDMDVWHKKMTQVVGMVLDRLGTTLITWDVFQKSHIGYFLHNGNSDPSHLQAHSPRQPDSLRAIEEAFRDLWAIQQKVELLRQSLKNIGEEASYWLLFRPHFKDANATNS